MIRYCAVALLALLPATTGVVDAGGKSDKEIKIEGKLSQDDPKDTRRNTPCKVHVAKLKAGRVYVLDMVSTQFDSYLRLEDKGGTQLAEDDDGGGNLNARITFTCSADGDYRIIATSFNQGVGDYTLTIRQAGMEQKTSAGHEVLIGKAAPDFQGEFAVNGQAMKLSDLKGKVVLLAFWEVRSSASVAVLPRLHEWHKAHKAEGLEVVGVTFYNFELGHKLGFDKENGKVTYLPKASKESEQTLLRDFAAYHKVEHLLLALPGKAALDAFNAYLVNGLPQFVLIDRQGVVRMIRVGEGETTKTALDAEMKKLLAEK